ncbi:transposase [Mesorhizobium ciceri]|uniref:transposase n=1 Tax=Mesorhizobium TaxID=68287 RepID=UPI0012DF19A2|nr:transposase [Mesorhizobium ciceri]
MLLSLWYDLSDVKLAEALDDRGSFRRFCGFSAQEPTPERTAFVRFRKALVVHGLDKTLFDEITCQLKAKAIQVKTGTLVDATIIAWTSEDDEEGHWVKHKGRPAFMASRPMSVPTPIQLWLRRSLSRPPTSTRARPVPMLRLTAPARCLPTAPYGSGEGRLAGGRHGTDAALLRLSLRA